MSKLNMNKRIKDIGIMLRCAPADYGLYGYVNNDYENGYYIFSNAYSIYMLNGRYTFDKARKQLPKDFIDKHLTIKEEDEENIIYYNDITSEPYNLMLCDMVYTDDDKKHLMLKEDKLNKGIYSIDTKYLKKAIEIMTNGCKDYVIKLNKKSYILYIVNDIGEVAMLLPCRNY